MNLFTYGSLMLPEVWQAVTGKPHPSQPATITGYIRRKVAGYTFPAILQTEKNTDTVAGQLYQNIPPDSVPLLDEFESDFYKRETIQARSKNNETITCQAYTITAAQSHLLSKEDWNQEKFTAHHLKTFLNQINTKPQGS